MSSPKDKLNTVYIISKGRPRCTTARTLSKMNFPGEWFIVCGNNDETLPEYRKLWGDRVLVFDWYAEVGHTRPMDGFGFEDKASGACPVRNATARISRDRGEERHWQFDDDYNNFQRYDPATGKNKTVRDGRILLDAMKSISAFGHAAGLSNVGFCQSTMESHPDHRHTFGNRVFNAHNLPSAGPLFVPWVARMNDDLINAVNVWRTGGVEMQFKFVQMVMEKTQQESGGLTEMYRQDGTVRKTAYAVVACPLAARLTVRFGRYYHVLDFRKIRPKLLHERFRRGGE